jgi:hypothetical protein
MLEDLLSEVRCLRRRHARGIRDRMALAGVEFRVDLGRQHRPAPAIFQRRPGVPAPGGRVLHVQELDVLAPGPSSNDPLGKVRLGPRLGESPHIERVGARVAPCVGELVLEVGGEAIDDPGAPAMGGLAAADIAAVRQWRPISPAFTASEARGVSRMRAFGSASQAGQPSGAAGRITIAHSLFQSLARSYTRSTH